MKFTKKRVVVAALAVGLVAIISAGSLAWFSASDKVDNKFMVAASDDDTADEVFSVDVYEYVNGNTSEKEQTGATYSDIQPGDVLKKQAHVTNTGYYDQYIRVTVTISQKNIWKDTLGTNYKDEKLLSVFEGYDSDKWANVSTKEDGNNIVITMYYKDILDGDDTDADGETTTNDITVFNSVKIPTELTREQAARFNEGETKGFTITVKADAVQTENVVPENANLAEYCEAYYAFQTVESRN